MLRKFSYASNMIIQLGADQRSLAGKDSMCLYVESDRREHFKSPTDKTLEENTYPASELRERLSPRRS